MGPGRVGQALGKLLAQSGQPIGWVAARRPKAARQAVKFIGSGKPVGLRSRELAKARVMLLTTSDTGIQSVARGLASISDDWRGKVLLHTCGSLSLEATRDLFGLLRRQGAAVGFLHPFQTIPTAAAGVRNLLNCFWSVDGDPQARHVASRWVKALGGSAFRLRHSSHILYHASAFLTCPTVVALMDQSIRLLCRSGVPKRVAQQMLGQFVAETARNFAETGARRALTGPAVRGDWNTIRHHIEALQQSSPELAILYKAVLPLMLRLAGKKMPSSFRTAYYD